MPDFSPSGKSGEDPLHPNTALGGAEGHGTSRAAVGRLWGRGAKWTQPSSFLPWLRAADGKSTSGVFLQGVTGRLLQGASHMAPVVTVSAKRSRK